MNGKSSFACSICGEEKASENGWFLLTEDTWLDRLKVLHWNDTLARDEVVHCLCSAAHVQELVAHWMVTGSLSYPFATASGACWETALKAFPATRPEDDPSGGPTTGMIGELAVHRESLERVLEESPHSLSTILEALLEALEAKTATTKAETYEQEEELALI